MIRYITGFGMGILISGIALMFGLNMQNLIIIGGIIFAISLSIEMLSKTQTKQDNLPKDLY